MSVEFLEKRAVISGIGQSEVGRRLGRDPLDLTLDACLAKELRPEAVSGRAHVVSYTWNHQAWVPAPDHPYPIAIVEIAEQPGLRLMTNLVGCGRDEVHIGMAVRATFEQHGDVYIPLFEPVREP